MHVLRREEKNVQRVWWIGVQKKMGRSVGGMIGLVVVVVGDGVGGMGPVGW